MDARLVIASKRDRRDYADRPIPDDLALRILDAGRLAGSSRNQQQRTFVVLETSDLVERFADTVYAPDNVRRAALVVAIVVTGRGPTSFDAGRAAQNMMLAAWDEGVLSCPNGIAEQDQASELLGLGEDEQLVIVLSFGYPERLRDPARRSPEEWSASANRKPLDELVRRV